MAGGLPFADRGVDLTRNFKALKVWMSLKAYGMDRFVEAVERNVDQARHVAGRVDGHADLERLAPAPLNIVCFRYRPSERTISDEALDALNREILLQLQEKGIAVPSSTRIGGRYAIRAAFVGHRTTLADADALIDGVLRLGEESL
jgi:glutamate/tyrosine decarboxylase-like PLP-dependent enzyme